jgi:hypothetical protein
MKTVLVITSAMLFATPSVAQQSRPSWTGSEVAATAQPLRVRDLDDVARSRGVPVRREPGRPYGYRPPRSIYVDPYGNVTTFAGQTPYWMQPQPRPYGHDGATPAERAYYGGPQQSYQQAQPQYAPSPSIGGPATASSALSQAAKAYDGR